MATKKAKAKAKDLAPKKSTAVKGGGRWLNANMTLVRQAKKPVTKDLSPSKNPKGGVKRH